MNRTAIVYVTQALADAWIAAHRKLPPEMRILIVDDDAFARRTLDELLTPPDAQPQVCAEPPAPRGAQWKRERASHGRRR